MKLQYASDLHLEFAENKSFLGKRPLEPKAELLVLAGDITPFTEIGNHRDFFDFVSDNFRMTYWVPGNHEYYRSDINDRSGGFTEQIRKNVLLVNNSRAVEGNVSLLFTTLWTRISALRAWQIEKDLSDFRLIRKDGGGFLSEHYNDLHTASLTFLEKELTRDDNLRTVVVTHHVPTLQNYPPQFIGTLLNEAFAVDLDKMIGAYGPACWIYGHHHQPVKPFRAHNTTLVTNQLGYVQLGEHLRFKRDAVMEVI